MQIIDDDVIIQLIRSNRSDENDRAFSYLYQAYYELIQKNVINNNGKDQDAEDIFQDGLIVLYHQVKKNNLILTCKLKTYFYSICRNLWLKKLRKTNRVVKLSDTMKEYITVEETHFKTIEKNEQKIVIAQFLDQLSNGCKEILSYFYFQKIGMADIAVRMNLANEQVAKNKKSGCMKKLKTLIKTSSFFK